MRIKTITLDLWDTLIQEVPRYNPAVRDLRMSDMLSELKELGYSFDLDRMERAYQLSGEFCREVWGRNRDMPMDDHLLLLLSCLDGRLPSKLRGDGLDRVRRAYAETLLRQPPKLYGDVKGSLDALRAAGYRLGLISNTGRTPGDVLRVLLDQMKVGRYFEQMTFSDEVLVRKPERGIFAHTLGRLHTLPRLSLHVGDDPVADFQGAKNAGMEALLMDRTARGGAEGTVDSLSEVVELVERL